MDYKQKHPETCLAKCLIILLEKSKNIIVPKRYELELLVFSLKYARENIARGHLEKIVGDFKVKIAWIVDSRIFYRFIRRLHLPKTMQITQKPITLSLIDSLLSSPLILYVDRFFLWKKAQGLYHKYHYPHFIIVKRKVGSQYEIIDPEDGKAKRVSPTLLHNAIKSLKSRLWISPQVIALENG